MSQQDRNITLDEHQYELVRRYERAVLKQAGEELAAKMPKFYGKVTFNIQNGKYVNANVSDANGIERSVR
jgi:hypothetical protein